MKGRGTHVVVTEYDLPRPTIEPHDVVFANGYAWYTNFGEQYIGRLDPKTGQHKEFRAARAEEGLPDRLARSQARQGRHPCGSA